MNVLQLNQSDIEGGAAIAAHRLHLGLRQKAINSRLMVPRAALQEETTTLLPPMSLAEKAFFKLTFPLFPHNTNILRTWKIFHTAAYHEADILHAHNLHSGLYFNYLALPRMSHEKPVVLTLHDMWDFTGHCSYSYDCEKWRTGCGHCPYPKTYPAVRWDSTALEHWLKRQVYAKSRLTIIAPSHWLAQLARQSMLGKFPVHMIPNGLDTSIYRPIDQAESRSHLSLPADKIILMTSSTYVGENRKGVDHLQALLKFLPEAIKRNIIIYALGHTSPKLGQTLGVETIQTGYIEDDQQKALAYSAADLFISTTRADNLPVVLQESLACGTPILASDVGGVGELVRHGETGFTAPLNDLPLMTSLLIELIQNRELRQKMSLRCREVALQDYALDRIVDQHVALYESLLREA